MLKQAGGAHDEKGGCWNGYSQEHTEISICCKIRARTSGLLQIRCVNDTLGEQMGSGRMFAFSFEHGPTYSHKGPRSSRSDARRCPQPTAGPGGWKDRLTRFLENAVLASFGCRRPLCRVGTEDPKWPLGGRHTLHQLTTQAQARICGNAREPAGFPRRGMDCQPNLESVRDLVLR